MADAHGSKAGSLKPEPDGALEDRLLSQGERFAFSQAYRLLRLLSIQDGKTDANIQVLPNLSLDFPGTDLSAIKRSATGKYQLTANFLGLYGVSSPLPNFYTEDLLDERHDGRHSNRDFLDIFSQTIYPLFFRAWLKSRAHVRIKEFNDTRLLEIFHSFVGINQPLRFIKQSGFARLLRFAGLFSQYPRSAMGLQTIIQAIYPGAVVDLEQQHERWQPIAPRQRCLLGQANCELGETSHLGEKIRCRSGNLTLRIQELRAEQMQQMRPGSEAILELKFLIRYYLTNPLEIRLELYPKAAAVVGLRLGAPSWSRLGEYSWLKAGAHATDEPLVVQI